MTQEVEVWKTDQEIVEDIKNKSASLNATLKAAHIAGLIVRMDIYNFAEHQTILPQSITRKY